MEHILQMIRATETMADLEYFLRLPYYRNYTAYWYAIFDRHAALTRQDPTHPSILHHDFMMAMPPAMYLLVDDDDGGGGGGSQQSNGGNDHEPDEDITMEDVFIPEAEWQQQQGGAEAAADQELDHFYELGQQQVRPMPRFNTDATTAAFRFRNLADADNVDQALLAAVLDDALARLLGNDRANPNARIGLRIQHPALDHPLVLPFSKAEDINGETILRELERLQQSGIEVRLDELMRIELVRIILPGGQGRRDFRGKWQPWFDRHHGHGGCFIKIKNDDGLCCARAIVTAKARLHKDEGDEQRAHYKLILRGDASRHTAQREEARQLMRDAGLADFDGACGQRELGLLQDALGANYQIKVFWKENYNNLFYEGPKAERVIYLLLHDNHYTVITSMAAFFNTNYWCDECNKKFDHVDKHRCEKRCYGCNRIGPDFPCPLVKWQRCIDCNRNFRSQQCFDAHKVTTTTTKGRGAKRQRVETSVCQRIHSCPRCDKTVNEAWQNGEPHHCGQSFCGNCRKYKPKGHQCYVQPIEEKDDDDNAEPPKFIFFDFESQQDVEVGHNAEGPIYAHVPNLCVVQRACDECKASFDAEGNCAACGRLQQVFKGADCERQFCEWLFDEANAGAIAIAHNAKGYDAQFLLKYLQEQSIEPTVVLAGLKIIKLEACGIKVIDSLNYLPMALAAFPKAFGLKELKKGYFPHAFNRRDNAGYKGAWPPIGDYWPERMTADKRAVFEQWYEEQRDKQFDLDKELLDYCVSDVTLLRQGCLEFRKLFMSETDVDPFVRATTIASACNYVFRRNYLQEDTIGLIPHGGYRREQKQSVVAIKWLKYIAEQRRLDIQHVLNGFFVGARREEHRAPFAGGEARIGRYTVDGLNRNAPLVYEFHGCAWHGCERCFPDREKKLPNGMTAADSFARTVARRLYIEAQGYTVEEKWECELRRELKANPEMKRFFDALKLHEPLDPRDAFYGGRTNATKLLHRCSPTEKIEYLDVVSLYPWTNKYGAFPIGHPQIRTENLDPDHIAARRDIRGLLKCLVLPPRRLLHPVLPRRSNNKLCFPLCGKCADELNKDECKHTDEERKFWGSWASLEVYAALDQGYQLLDVAETWHYDRWAQYDGKDPDSGLFTRYINSFLKLKQQASGWPSEVQTDEDKERYIKEYEEKEGISLDPERVEFNAGLRQLSKLCLNSFWGKFGQRNNLSKSVYFTDCTEYFRLIMDPENEIQGICAVSDAMVCVTYRKREEFIDALPNTNLLVAVYTTTHARLKLHSYLQTLQDRVLYFDTDSVIYLTREGETSLTTGNYLGDLSSEVPDGSHISEFVGAGPKQYAYKLTTPGKEDKFVLKIRGFRIDSGTSTLLNFTEMKRMVTAFVRLGVQEEVVIRVPSIRVTPTTKQLVTKILRKRYRVIYTKRRVMPDFTTVPFGY